MYYHNHENYLFRDGSLDVYLRERDAKLRTEVQGLNSEELTSMDEITLTRKLVAKYAVLTPAVTETQKKIDAREGEVSVRGSFDNDDEPYTAKGLHITLEVPFSGDAELFQLRASTYSVSGTPAATVHTDKLILLYQTTEEDPEKIKQLWQKDVEEIKKNLGWIDRDVAVYNANLEKNVSTMVAERRKEALAHQSVIDKIKLG